MFNLLSKFYVTTIAYNPHKFGNTHTYIPVFVQGMKVQQCSDSRLGGRGFLLQSFVHISSIGNHHSSAHQKKKKKFIHQSNFNELYTIMHQAITKLKPNYKL